MVGSFCGHQYFNTMCQPPFTLSCQMTYTMPFEPQHLVVLHPWGRPCSAVIKGDFIFKGVENNLVVHPKKRTLGMKATWCY